MLDDKWQDWEWIGGYHFDEYVLYQCSDTELEKYLIMHLPTLKILAIENDESYRALKEKMKQAGSRIVTDREVWILMGRDPADLPDF